ncbi:MAG: Xaa-Pro peptidase family protein [Anaerolineae bacterium]
MTMDYNARMNALRKAAGLDTGSVDAVILVPGANFVYFFGLEFHLSERPTLAVLTKDGLSLIVPFLEMPKVNERPDLEIRPFAWKDEDGYMGAFRSMIDDLGLRGKTLGVDGMTMRVSEWLALQSIDSTLKIATIEKAVVGVRARKNPDEIAALRKAIQISEAALDQLVHEIQPGMTEAQIAARLEQLMSNFGAHGYAFGSLVQSGANSSNPHGFTTDRALGFSEFLIIDWGAKYEGYMADLTRTFCFGTPTAEMQKIYDTVLAANTAAKALVKPGVPMSAIDKAARDVITAAGYGEYFTHRTGHGLGLEGAGKFRRLPAKGRRSAGTGDGLHDRAGDLHVRGWVGYASRMIFSSPKRVSRC